MISNTNVGSASAPGLRCYMNLMALDSLHANSRGPRDSSFRECLQQLREAGFEGVQFTKPASPDELRECAELSMGIAVSGRMNVPAEVDRLAVEFAADSYECATLHVGWGLEDDVKAHRLIDAILNASERRRIPLYVETHRATIFKTCGGQLASCGNFPASISTAIFRIGTRDRKWSMADSKTSSHSSRRCWSGFVFSTAESEIRGEFKCASMKSRRKRHPM